MENAQSKPVAHAAPSPELKFSHPQKKLGWNTKVLTAIIALIISLLTALALIAFYSQVSSTLKEVTTSLQAQTTQNQMQNQQLSDAVTELQTQMQQQKIALTDIQQLSTGNVSIWRFAEAKYLVQLANYHLTFTRDVPAALALLQTAEQPLLHSTIRRCCRFVN